MVADPLRAWSLVLGLVVRWFLGLAPLGSLGAADVPVELEDALRAVRAVGREGEGNAAASAAWRRLAQAPVSAAPAILAGMDGASDLAVNWLWTAVNAAVVRASGSGDALPVAELGVFLLETEHHPRARQLAYELIARADASAAAQLLPGFLSDPCLDLRRQAVQRLIDEGERVAGAGNRAGAILLYRQALVHARELGQIETLTQRLRKLGQRVDPAALLGFLREWQVIGPFDNTGRAGFDRAFPPELETRLDAEYDGKTGKVRWADLTSTNEYGVVDLNRPCGKLKEVAGYARTEFVVDRAQPGEIRLGCKNAWKVWCNGRFLFGRDEYHRGAEIDQYRLPVQLEPGPNVILVKLCQNEEVEEWTVEWEFQLRVCDPLGTPIRPSPSASAATRGVAPAEERGRP